MDRSHESIAGGLFKILAAGLIAMIGVTPAGLVPQAARAQVQDRQVSPTIPSI